MTVVTVGRGSSEIEQYLFDELGVIPIERMSLEQIPAMTKIFVNGNWIGMHSKPEYIIKSFLKYRRSKSIISEVSIVRNIASKEIKLFSDSGRVARPLLIVENGELCIQKEHI